MRLIQLKKARETGIGIFDVYPYEEAQNTRGDRIVD